MLQIRQDHRPCVRRHGRARPHADACQLWHAALLLVAVALSGSAALAQDTSLEPAAGEQRINGHTVRWNTTVTSFLPQQAVKTHNLRPSGRGVLNVVVLKDSEPDQLPETVAADVSAQLRNLRGQIQRLDMRRIEAHGRISYLGTFDVDDGDQLRFELSVHLPGETPLAIAFEQRFVIQ
jgi:hypothetical protein